MAETTSGRRRRRSAAKAGAAAVDGDGSVTGRTSRQRSTDGTGGPRPEPTLRILETRVLRGANYWAREPVIRQVVDLGVLEEFPSNTIPGFVEALVELLPDARGSRLLAGPPRRVHHPAARRDLGRARGRAHRARAPEPRRHRRPPRQDARHRASTAATTSSSNTARSSVGLEAGKMAVALVNHLVAPNDPAFAFDLMAELETLIRLAERLAFGPSTQALLDEAASRDIPFMRLDRYSLVQLGQGVHQQRIRATMTSRTSGIAVDIASDKKLTNRLLDSAGSARAAVRGRRDGGRGGRARPAASATRASSSRSTATTAGASCSTSATRRASAAAFPVALRAEPVPGRHRRGVHHGQRLPLPDHRRQPGGRRRAGAGKRDRRRNDLDPRAGRDHQRRPPARHRPREGADEDQARRRAPRPSSPIRASRPTACRPPAPS